MKVLLLRFSSIGDIVLTTPVIRCIKKQRPDVEIHFATKKSFAPIVQSNPYVSKVHVLVDSFSELINSLQSENFDLVIDLHNNLRTARIKSALQIKSSSFNKKNFSKWMMVQFKSKSISVENIVHRYLQAAWPLGIVDDGNGLDYFIPQKDSLQQEDLPLTHLHGFVAIVVGAAHYTKRIPENKLEQLCEKITAPIILLGGKEDAEIGNRLSEKFPLKVMNACGKFNLNQSASLIKLSKKVITADTGLMHIAAALQKPIIAVWGNTVPEFGMSPYFGSGNQNHQISFEVENLSCRPCSKIGFQKCPKGHFNCMQQQDVDAIVKAVMN